MANFPTDYILARIVDSPLNSTGTTVEHMTAAPHGFGVEWIRRTSGAHGVAVTGTLAELAQVVTHDPTAVVPVYVLLPARLVVCVKVKLPTRNLRQMTQALPFVVEEQMSDDIELYHLVPDLDHSDVDKVLVQTTPLKVMDELLAQLSLVGIAPAGVYSEGAWLPSLPQQLTVMLNEGGLVLNHGGYHLAFDSENTDFMIPSVLEGSPDITTLVCYNIAPHTSASCDASSALALQAAAGGISFNEIKTTATGLAGLLEFASPPTSADLLYGKYVRREIDSSAVKWRKMALVAVMIVMAIQLVFNLGAGAYFGYEADKSRTAAEGVFRQLFPDEKRVSNIRSQMQARLSVLSGMSENGSFDYLFGMMAGYMHTPQGAELKITDIRYDASRGELLLGVDAKSIDGLEKSKIYLKDKGLVVNITSANEDGGVIKGRLQIVSGDKS